MPDAITGLWAGAATPIDTAGKIEHAALARDARRLLRAADATTGARIAAMLEAPERQA